MSEPTDEFEEDNTLTPAFGQAHPLKILLVEDDATNQQLFLTLFKELGYEVELARDDVEAENLISENAYQAIFMDIQLPGKTGLELIATTRKGGYGEANKTTFIIALTAFALPEDKQRCYQRGANAHLSKPFRLPALKEVLLKASSSYED